MIWDIPIGINIYLSQTRPFNLWNWAEYIHTPINAMKLDFDMYVTCAEFMLQYLKNARPFLCWDFEWNVSSKVRECWRANNCNVGGLSRHSTWVTKPIENCCKPIPFTLLVSPEWAKGPWPVYPRAILTFTSQRHRSFPSSLDEYIPLAL